jgi:hypothetical protein
MSGKNWKKCSKYQRLMEILDGYWLSEPDEAYVSIDMEFLKSDGQYQQKRIVWWNPNMDSEKTSAMLKQKHKDMQEAYEEAKHEGLFINLGEE